MSNWTNHGPGICFSVVGPDRLSRWRSPFLASAPGPVSVCRPNRRCSVRRSCGTRTYIGTLSIQASRVYADAMMHNEPQIADLVGLYALISRMRVLSSPTLVACAERIAGMATDSYSVPNKTIARDT